MTASRPVDPELTRLSPFRILRTLARGGMSEVYLGLKDGPFEGPDKVVLKVLRLPRDVPADAPRVREMLARLIEEGRLGLRLSHPSIAQSFGVLRDHHQDLYFLVQEFVDGLTLGDLMDYYSENGQRIPYGVVLRLIIPVLQALQYGYHTASREDGRPLRVVHRDIKPDNIMLAYNGQVKLVDFGVARSTSLTRQVTVGDVVVGTRHYMAPEQVFTPDQVGHRADLFSLGLILYELCTLKPVFPRTRAVSEFANALANFKFEDHAPLIDARRYPGIREVLAKVLRAEAKDRYASAGEMARDLQELEVNAPSNPTLMDFALELKSEIAEAEGAATIMGQESAAPPPPTSAQASAAVRASAPSFPGPGQYAGAPPGAGANASVSPRPTSSVSGPVAAPNARASVSGSPNVQPWDAPLPNTQKVVERLPSDRMPAVEPWDAPVRRASIIPGAAQAVRTSQNPSQVSAPIVPPPVAGGQSLLHSPTPFPSPAPASPSASGPHAKVSTAPPLAPSAGYPDVTRSSQVSMPPTPVPPAPRPTQQTGGASTASPSPSSQAQASAKPGATNQPAAANQTAAAGKAAGKAAGGPPIGLIIGAIVVVVALGAAFAFMR